MISDFMLLFRMDDPIIVDLSADNPVYEMLSACMECFEEGTTRLLLTKVPYFKEIIVSSFSCEHCHNSNTSVQPASSFCDKGIRYTLTVTDHEDLNRQIIKSEWGFITIPDVELEIPRESQKGSSSTVEGFITKTRDGLLVKQDERREVTPDIAVKIENFCNRLDELLLMKTPFSFTVEDPTGNSFIENPNAPKEDPKLKVEYYTRSKDDEDVLGITMMKAAQNEETSDEEIENPMTTNETAEVMTFEAMCNACGKEASCNMKEVTIPFFKTILLMANVCDHCGYKDSEVKSSGGIAEKGQRIILKITDSEMDLNRDILKSETAKLLIPELELELVSGSLGGRFTTVEGLLNQVKEQMETINPFAFGDSSSSKSADKMKEVIGGIDDILTKERHVEIILEDPAGNSYVQNVYAPDDDPHLQVIEYDRTEDDDDELGIKDMKIEGYENDDS